MTEKEGVISVRMETRRSEEMYIIAVVAVPWAGIGMQSM